MLASAIARIDHWHVRYSRRAARPTRRCSSTSYSISGQSYRQSASPWKVEQAALR